MTPQRRRLRPLVVLMLVATALVYVAAGGGVVDRGTAVVAAGAEFTAPMVADRIAAQTPFVSDSDNQPPAPPDAETAEVATDADLSQADRGGEVVPADDAYPVRVRIPGIDVDAAVVDLGIAEDGTLEVPTDFGVTGWYTGRSVPGEVGPSVVVGHVDSHTGPAVFYELSRLEIGDVIQIDRSDGLVAWFQIREVTLVDKDDFPTQQVYGDTAEPTLRLITCGGDFDRSERSYRGNLIVFADHLGNTPTGTSPEELSRPRAGTTTSGSTTRA